MANNDYWAYLRNENELKHYRTKGSKNGYSTNPDYKPIGQIAKGVWDEALGRYEYKKEGVPSVKEFGTRLGSALKKAAGSIKENIRQKQIINRNNKLEAKRTNYGDMASGGRATARNIKDTRYIRDSGGRLNPVDATAEFYNIRQHNSREKQQAWKDQAEDASQKRKAALEEEYRNTHRDADARPQDAMKEAQAKARQEADERKMYEDWLAEQEKAKAKKKREASLARNTANMQRWGYKDEDDAGSLWIGKDEDLKKLKESVQRKPEKKTVAVDANTGRIIPGYNPSPTGNTGYGNLGEKWRKNKSRS